MECTRFITGDDQRSANRKSGIMFSGKKLNTEASFFLPGPDVSGVVLGQKEKIKIYEYLLEH